MIEIRRHDTGEVLYRVDADTLDGVDLREQYLFLPDADLSNRSLKGAMLDGVDLMGASLRESDLSGASLRRANLFESDLRDACSTARVWTR